MTAGFLRRTGLGADAARLVPFCERCKKPAQVLQVDEEMASGGLFIKVACHDEEEVIVVTPGMLACAKHVAPIYPSAFGYEEPRQLWLDLGGA